jgi:hypothetical protein
VTGEVDVAAELAVVVGEAGAALPDETGRGDGVREAELAEDGVARRQHRLADMETGEAPALHEQPPAPAAGEPARRGGAGRTAADHDDFVVHGFHRVGP